MTFENTFNAKKAKNYGQKHDFGISYRVLKSFRKYGDEITVFDSQNNLVGRQILKI